MYEMMMVVLLAKFEHQKTAVHPIFIEEMDLHVHHLHVVWELVVMEKFVL